MPGEGISIAIHKVTGWPFPKAKIRVDITLVVLAVLFCFLLLGSWKWEIVGIGTLFAMVYVGVTVRLFNKHLACSTAFSTIAQVAADMFMVLPDT